MALRSLWCTYIRRMTRNRPNTSSLSGRLYHECRVNAGIAASSSGTSICTWEQRVADFPGRDFYAQRFSTVAEKSQGNTDETDLVSFIISAFSQPNGPHHCWLNRAEEGKDVSIKEGIILLLVDGLLPDSESHVGIQTAKYLQQRYPGVHVCALQQGLSVYEDSNRLILRHLIIKDYITFPILLTKKTFPEMLNGSCYVLFKGSEDPQIFHKNTELEILQKAIKDLHEERNEISSSSAKLKSSWSKPMELSKEPSIGSFVRNLLLYFPACVCTDESRGRFFLSDSHHNRIIIFDGSGKILDSIGFSPGFEDGDFENAKLLRPAGSFYQASDNSLYFVDSENHAIRRADMNKRVVDTMYPNGKEKESGGLWAWIRTIFGMNKEINTKSDDLDPGLLMFPWHLIKLEDDHLLIMNNSCSYLWIMRLHTWVIENVVKGSQNILETYGQHIGESISFLETLPKDRIQHLGEFAKVSDNISTPTCLSSFAMCGSRMLICDKVGHRVLAQDLHSGVISKFQLSNFGVLGLPYWLLRSLEKVYSIQKAYVESCVDHYESFTLLPGRVNMQLTIYIPSNTELVEPLQEGCIWRQARGAAVVVSELESIGTFDEKVGVSQQWYDELDNLAFATEAETSQEEVDSKKNDVQDDKAHIECVVNTSPGTCEVIIYAALYLRLKKDSPNIRELCLEGKVAMLADIMKPKGSGKLSEERDAFVQMLANSNSSNNLEDLVFMKPLHVTIKLNTLDHTKNENTKSVVTTDSSIEVNVSL